MEVIKNVRQIVKFIKAKTQLKQEEIANEIGYSRTYLSDSMTTNTESVFDSIRIKYAKLLEGVNVAYSNENETDTEQSYINKRRTKKITGTEETDGHLLNQLAIVSAKKKPWV